MRRRRCRAAEPVEVRRVACRRSSRSRRRRRASASDRHARRARARAPAVRVMPRRLTAVSASTAAQRDDALQPQRAVDRVGGEGQRHRGARAGLADHEAPAGDEAPPLAEPLAAVDVRAAGGRVLRGELRGRDRVAVRDAGGEREPDQQPAAGRRGGRARTPRRRPPRSSSRARSRRRRACRAGGRARGRGHIAAATRCAAAASSSSGTFGRTSSQSGSIIPAASTMPSGRGISQTWKCAPPSPQR